MLTHLTARVIGVKRGIQSESPQPDRMEVQDPPKWTVRSLKPGWHPPCQVGRHGLTTPRCLTGDVQDPEHIDLGQEEVSKVIKNPLQNHNRMDSGKR